MQQKNKGIRVKIRQFIENPKARRTTTPEVVPRCSSLFSSLYTTWRRLFPLTDKPSPLNGNRPRRDEFGSWYVIKGGGERRGERNGNASGDLRNDRPRRGTHLDSGRLPRRTIINQSINLSIYQSINLWMDRQSSSSISTKALLLQKLNQNANLVETNKSCLGWTSERVKTN